MLNTCGNRALRSVKETHCPRHGRKGSNPPQLCCFGAEIFQAQNLWGLVAQNITLYAYVLTKQRREINRFVHPCIRVRHNTIFKGLWFFRKSQNLIYSYQFDFHINNQTKLLFRNGRLCKGVQRGFDLRWGVKQNWQSYSCSGKKNIQMTMIFHHYYRSFC